MSVLVAMDGPEPPVRARFGQVNVVVSDMARSLAFYRLLGVEVDQAMPEEWKPHHQEALGVGDTTFELDSSVSAKNWAGGWDSDRTGVVLGFHVDSDRDVDTAVAAMADAGHRVIQPPHLAFFGARYAVVEDPDGNAVGIMGPIDESRRSMPELPS